SHADELQNELARMRSEMLALLAVNQTMRASRDLASLYRAVAAQLSGVVRCDSLFIALYLPEIDSVHFVYSVDESVVDDSADDQLLLDESPLSARIIRGRRVVQIDDLDHERQQLQGTLIAFGQTDRRSRSWLGAPMISGDQIQGVLSVQSYQPAAFKPADADLLLLLASQVGVAVENACLFQQLRSTIAELSAPLLPVADGVLVLPLVGRIDAERAERVLEHVLDAVIARQADQLVIDVTGLAAVDAHGIAQLLKIIRAAALLGTRSSIVGISSTLASTAASLDLGLHEITTYRDLRSALADILREAS
ncbi:MAG: GAF domain-containing protein, partial [Chloroflexota bacterium]|nr:GAF domain-containing protein [Chloroflexota bacterium]